MFKMFYKKTAERTKTSLNFPFFYNFCYFQNKILDVCFLSSFKFVTYVQCVYISVRAIDINIRQSVCVCVCVCVCVHECVNCLCVILLV